MSLDYLLSEKRRLNDLLARATNKEVKNRIMATIKEIEKDIKSKMKG